MLVIDWGVVEKSIIYFIYSSSLLLEEVDWEEPEAEFSFVPLLF